MQKKQNKNVAMIRQQASEIVESACNSKRSQKELAKIYGVSSSSFTGVKTGIGTVSLNALCNVLNGFGYELVIQRKGGD